MRGIIALVIFLVYALSAYCEVLEGRVLNDNDESISDATIIVSRNDSIVGMVTSDSKGFFIIKSESLSDVRLEVIAIGYETEYIASVGNQPVITVKLTKITVGKDLDEVVIEADRSEAVKRVANGERFFLSKEARSLNDPFMALKEIPTIISDPANSSIKTLNGDSPLILINGMSVNSGIQPILPADIEYVEVIDAPSARYLSQGVKKILNIKLKKNRAPYLWVELASRNELPVRDGMGVGYFEVGNEKYSLYGRAAYNYTHNDDSDGNTTLENVGYSQMYDWTKRGNGHSILGELLFKYSPTERDYFALQLYETNKKDNVSTTGHGLFKSDQESVYVMSSDDRDQSSIFTSSAYYKHNFDEDTELEIKGGFNRNSNKLKTNGVEYFGETDYISNILFDNNRLSGNVNAVFNKNYSNGNSLEVGVISTFIKDKITLTSNPVFNHSDHNEYAYGGFSGNIRKINYMASIGVETTWLRSAGISNSYVRPRGTTSITYSPNFNNSLRLNYTINNTSPEVNKLNPYNTSTDSLIIVEGNPLLVPEMMQDIEVSYIFNKGRLFAGANSGVSFYHDMLVASGYTNSDHVYVSTYANQGHYREFYSSINGSYRIGQGDRRARVMAFVNWTRRFYSGLSPMDEFTIYSNINVWLKKFYVGVDLSYKPKGYTDISVTRYHNLTEANIQCNYNIMPNLYVAICIQGVTGTPTSTTYLKNGTFRSVLFTRLKEMGVHPWILVRWNIRKNQKRKINLDSVLESTEKGIRLK